MARFTVSLADPTQHKERLNRVNVCLWTEIDKRLMCDQILGSSAALRKVLPLVKSFPRNPVFWSPAKPESARYFLLTPSIGGPRRSSRGLVRVDCAAISRDPIASELFGYEKAFTARGNGDWADLNSGKESPSSSMKLKISRLTQLAHLS